MRLLLIALAASLAAAPLAAAQPSDGLVGTWQRTGSAAPRLTSTGDTGPDVPAAPYRLTFNGAGSLAVEAGTDLTYTFDGQTLGIRIGADGAFEPIEASLDGDRLTITDLDSRQVYVFTRDGGADGIVGRWLRPEEAPDEPTEAPAGFEFAADGTARAFYGASVRYVAERGTLVTGDPLPMVANVRVTGDRLRLVQKNRVTTYARVGGGAADARMGGGAVGEPVVSLQRTACYGRCPEYTLAAYADGRVVWTGRRNVTLVGTAERRVELAVVTALVAAAKAAGHAGLPETIAGGDVCLEFATDNPDAITTVRLAAGTHAVVHNSGCRGFQGESALTAFEREIDRALGTPAWSGAPGSGAPR